MVSNKLAPGYVRPYEVECKIYHPTFHVSLVVSLVKPVQESEPNGPSTMSQYTRFGASWMCIGRAVGGSSW